MTYPLLAYCLWVLAWLFTGIVVVAGWAVMRGHGVALPVLAAVAAGLAAVVLAYSGAVLW